MKTYLYLNLIPEALVASHLAPTEFGPYLATGTKKRTRGQAIFFEVDPAVENGVASAREAEDLCRPHEDGSPRRSTYLGIYRILERVPLAALGRLFLTTDDGRVLPLEKGAYQPEPGRSFHLYQEFCPVKPRVVSSLAPSEFVKRITDPKEKVSVPRIVFAEMKLEELAIDPEAPEVENLPYPNLEHLRDCLRELSRKQGKPTKTVVRHIQQDILFRTIRGGFFVGDAGGLLHYPMPPIEDLESKHYAWWRSALMTFGH
ncbi:MAG: hypothetical protein EA425_03030 [Puniceicoccaceae bacterium]|nr:MAG: hypothetical protein EA425_03030 [Puniceicoccaceae bacterium]